MASFQQIIILGHLGKDPETRVTGSSTKTAFSVAVSEKWKDKNSGEAKEKTEWFNVVAWKKDWLQDRIQKGDLVQVTGKIETRSYEDKNGQKKYVVELIAATVMPLSSRPAGAGSPSPAAVPQFGTNPEAVTDDDIPF